MSCQPVAWSKRCRHPWSHSNGPHFAEPDRQPNRCHPRRRRSAQVRRVNQNGLIMVAGQSLRVGRTYAVQTVVVAIEDTVLRVLLNDVELTTHARTPGLQITVLKAYPRRQAA